MKIITAIASTTHIDKHNERMSKAALEGMANNIRSKLIPYLIEHDPGKQIGIVLSGKVVKLEDGEFALYVVLGIFENDQERKIYKIGFPNTVWGEYEHYLDNLEDTDDSRKSGDKSHQHKRKSCQNVAELLETHLDSTQIWIDGRVYKIKRYIASVGGLQVHVRPKDHLPPHFHVISKQRGINARFGLSNLELLNCKTGQIRKDDIKKIKNFFETNPELLEKLKSEHARMCE